MSEAYRNRLERALDVLRLGSPTARRIAAGTLREALRAVTCAAWRDRIECALAAAGVDPL